MNKKQLTVAGGKSISIIKIILIRIRNFIVNNATLILAICALISLGITYSNVELVNRPFVGIENVYWIQIQNSDWFFSGFKIKNYGNKPALDYSVRNFRVIVMSLNKELLKEKLKNDNKQLSEQYFDEYLLDLRNKVCRESTDLLSNYFYKHPGATQTEVTNFLNSWNNVLPKNNILKYNEKLLVGIVEVNNDMFGYFSKNSQLIYPNQDNLIEHLTTQMGKSGISSIENGDNFIIIYWAIKYKGLTNKFINPFRPKIYSTYYTGYNREPRNKELQEFRSWSRVE